MIEATFKNADRFIARMKQHRLHTEKSLDSALRIEGFRIRKVLKAEITAGAPGGKKFPELTYIAKRLTRTIKIMGGATQRQNPNRNPLKRLSVGVRYEAYQNKDQGLVVAVGFVGPGTGFDIKSSGLNKFGRAMGKMTGNQTWRWLAQKHQEGFTKPITPKLRKLVIKRGAELGKIEGGNTPFFLKKSTTSFHTPGRPIINPFWQAHEKEAWHNVQNNFRTKMAGRKVSWMSD